VYSALWPTPSYDFATLAVAGLAIVGLPAYFLIALPGLVLGLAILRLTSVGGAVMRSGEIAQRRDGPSERM
jgi:hypothetical protein